MKTKLGECISCGKTVSLKEGYFKSDKKYPTDETNPKSKREFYYQCAKCHGRK